MSRTVVTPAARYTAAHSICMTWVCISHRPGMIVFPATSMRRAPRGTGVVARGPAATIFPLVTTTVASDTGAAPVPSMRVAPTSATGPAASGVIVCVMRARSVMRSRVPLAIRAASFGSSSSRTASSVRPPPVVEIAAKRPAPSSHTDSTPHVTPSTAYRSSTSRRPDTSSVSRPRKVTVRVFVGPPGTAASERGRP